MDVAGVQCNGNEDDGFEYQQMETTTNPKSDCGEFMTGFWIGLFSLLVVGLIALFAAGGGGGGGSCNCGGGGKTDRWGKHRRIGLLVGFSVILFSCAIVFVVTNGILG